MVQEITIEEIILLGIEFFYITSAKGNPRLCIYRSLTNEVALDMGTDCLISVDKFKTYCIQTNSKLYIRSHR
jgi:hypothetical protein